MAVTKQSVIDIYNGRVRDPGVASFTVDTGSNPGATRIDTTKLGTGTFPQPATGDINTTLINGAKINEVFYTYARFLTSIRPIRHGYITDNFNPNTAETTADDTNTTAHLLDNPHKEDSLVPATGIASTPATGATIDLSNLQDFADNIYAAADDSLGSTRIDLRVCHSSCHNSCHGSRGRR